MGGVTEPVSFGKSLPGIVQVVQWLPLALVRRLDPLMGSYYDYMNVRTQISFSNIRDWDVTLKASVTDCMSRSAYSTFFGSHRLLTPSRIF